MSFPLQAKLLQVLQDGEFSRLGGKTDVQVDVRVVAATNRDLESAVAEGQFREDLYFRLNVVTIHLPPLRERREEIPLLTDHFLKKYSVQYNKPFTGVSSELAGEFMHYDWPGNVRQLENLIKRMVILGTEAPIFADLRHPPSPIPFRPQTGLPSRSAGADPYAPSPSPHAFVAMPPQPVTPPPVAAAPAPATPLIAAGAAAREAAPVAAALAGGVAASPAAGNVSLKDIARTAAREAERELILRMLTRTRWNRKEAAEILGISYKALLYKIKENGLDKAS
jgi:two-component system response regulator AtoC